VPRSASSPSGEHTPESVLSAALAPSSRLVYSRAIKTYGKFVQSYFPSRPCFPASVNLIVQFIVHLLNLGRAASSIATNLSAISYIHKLASLPDPTQSFLIKKMQVGVHRLVSKPDVRLPILPKILHQLVDSTPIIFSDNHVSATMQSMYLLLFHAFLRIGEITIQSQNCPTQSVIQFQDINFFRKSGSVSSMSITITYYKHNTSCRPVTLKVSATKGRYCPVARLLAYIQLRGSYPGPLYTLRDGSPVTRSFFTGYFNKSLHHIGLDPLYYKPHSFRVGATTNAFDHGIREERIQALGRWKSTAYKKYIRIPTIALS
jgi:hypothetical protein